MKISKLSILIGAGGLFVVVISTVRWFFLYPDWSQFGLGVSIGLGIILTGYVYEWMKRIDKWRGEIEHSFDGLNNYFHTEFDKLKK